MRDSITILADLDLHGADLAVRASKHLKPAGFELSIAPLEMAQHVRAREGTRHGLVLIDRDLGTTLDALERMNSQQRARTAVVTTLEHPLALDAIAAKHVAHVTQVDLSAEAPASSSELLHAALCALLRVRSYRWASGAPYMELRVIQQLARRHDRQRSASELCISAATVSAHLSNTLARFALKDVDTLRALLQHRTTTPLPTPAESHARAAHPY